MLAADRALYRAKNDGRDRFIVADDPQGMPEGPTAPGTDALEVLAESTRLRVDPDQSAEQLSLSVTLNEEPQPQAATTLGFSTLNPAPVSASTKSMTEPST